MHTDPRPQIRRRRFAIERLRSLSTSAVIAGIAGTAGFGLMAAMTWSGDPNATPLPAAPDTGTTGTNGATAPQAQPAAPNTGFGQAPSVTTPRSNRGTGGHAATGGSH